MDSLNDIITTLLDLPEEEKTRLVRDTLSTTSERWIPSPGPQTKAYFSEADILLYGGAPGGGKTSLILGLAFNNHQRSLIMRRQYTDISAIIEEAIKINGTRKGFNGSPPPSLRTADNRFVEFGAAMRLGDEQHWQGNPHDLIAFDEACSFAESQVRFLMGWLRSTDAGQRKRVVFATNPPLSSEGAWVMDMFAPWLSPIHPNPAREGELRWFVTDQYGKDLEVPGPQMVEVDGKLMKPVSRTYIHSSVKDNPYLADTDYQKQLDAMAEPFRSLLLGGFKTAFRDADNQCIPSSWIRAAQARWTPNSPPGVPMCAIGVDPAAGGEDDTVLAPRYDGWYAPLIATPGRLTPHGKDVAGLILSNRRDKALIVLDMGGGYGGETFLHLTENDIPVQTYKGSVAVETRTRDRQLKFYNKRSEAYWRFREALDPSQEGGSRIALPDDPKLMADLAAPTFEVTLRGIQLEPKEEVKKRLGRSPDYGDAVVMAWTAGPVFSTDGGEWINQREARSLNRTPKVVMGRQHNVRR